MATDTMQGAASASSDWLHCRVPGFNTGPPAVHDCLTGGVVAVRTTPSRVCPLLDMHSSESASLGQGLALLGSE
jgi:hypothetical protein